MKWKAPKVSKFKIGVSVLVVAIVAMVCAIGIQVNYLCKLKSELDNLYWILENTDSVIVGVGISLAEENFRRELTRLKVLIVMLSVIIIVSCVSWMLNRIYIKHKEAQRKSRIHSVALWMTGVILVSLLFVPTVYAADTVLYGRVRMDVPKGSHLIDISGYIAPSATDIFSSLVGYHVAVVFPTYPQKWIGGGYYSRITTEGVETFFYIEWLVDGVYDMISASGVIFGEQYCVIVHDETVSGGVGPPEPIGWGANIYDSDWNKMLAKNNVDVPYNSEERIVAVAGGESHYEYNPMRASYSDLKWSTYDPDAVYPDPQLEEGYWDGNKFACSLEEDSPYIVDMNVPYYDFTVRAIGLTNYPPNPPNTLSGPTSIYTDVVYIFTTSTIDPNGDNLMYLVHWGDGSTMSFVWRTSGKTVTVYHKWISTGTYNVRVKAKDEYDEWSLWSSNLTVTVTVDPRRKRVGGGGILMLK